LESKQEEDFARITKSDERVQSKSVSSYLSMNESNSRSLRLKNNKLIAPDRETNEGKICTSSHRSYNLKEKIGVIKLFKIDSGTQASDRPLVTPVENYLPVLANSRNPSKTSIEIGDLKL